MRNKKNLDAFTFVEILVVVTIIGIITTIGLVSYTEFLKQSRDSKRKGDLEQIRGALEMYRSKNNAYPGSITFGSNLCDPGGCAQGTYLTKIPNDPFSSRGTHTYYYWSDSTTYQLGAMVEQTPSSPSSCGTCVGATACNYCMGPYGQL